MQHFVIKNEFHGVRRNFGVVQPPVHHDLIERWIVAAELRAPRAGAPSEPRAAQAAREILDIERGKHRLQIVRHARGIVPDAPGALAANARDVPARGMRQRELPIQIAQFVRYAAAVHLPQQKCRGSLDHRHRRFLQNIGKPHVRDVPPQTQSVRKIGVRVQFHLKLRRPPLATEAREDALKNAVTPGKRCSRESARFYSRGLLGLVLVPTRKKFHQVGLRRTGGADDPLEAFSTSLAASCVASMASSRFSLYVSRSTPLAASSCRYGRNCLMPDSSAFTPSRMSCCFSMPISIRSAASSMHPV